MNPISITVTGHLGDAPRQFSTNDGTAGIDLRLAVEVPRRNGSGDSITRWVKVTAFGALARHVGESVGKGDRVIVQAYDFNADAWTAEVDGQTVARGQIVLRAYDISASMLRDDLRTGYATRKAEADATRQAAKDQPTE
jgi:single-stranded DNA-binding protein